MKGQERIKIWGVAGLEAVRYGRTETHYVRIRALAEGKDSGIGAEEILMKAPVSKAVYSALHEQLSSSDEHREPTLWASGSLELTVR